MDNTQNEILLTIISLIKSSENKYKEKNFKGSLEDKLEIKSLISKLSSNKEIMLTNAIKYQPDEDVLSIKQ